MYSLGKEYITKSDTKRRKKVLLFDHRFDVIDTSVATGQESGHSVRYDTDVSKLERM